MNTYPKQGKRTHSDKILFSSLLEKYRNYSSLDKFHSGWLSNLGNITGEGGSIPGEKREFKYLY